MPHDRQLLKGDILQHLSLHTPYANPEGFSDTAPGPRTITTWMLWNTTRREEMTASASSSPVAAAVRAGAGARARALGPAALSCCTSLSSVATCCERSRASCSSALRTADKGDWRLQDFRVLLNLNLKHTPEAGQLRRDERLRLQRTAHRRQHRSTAAETAAEAMGTSSALCTAHPPFGVLKSSLTPGAGRDSGLGQRNLADKQASRTCGCGRRGARLRRAALCALPHGVCRWSAPPGWLTPAGQQKRPQKLGGA